MGKARHYSEGTSSDDVLKTSDIHWDAMYGGDGDDTIIASLGYDFVDGGRGNDTFYVPVNKESLNVADYGDFLHVTYHTPGVPGPTATTELRGVENIATLTGQINPVDYIDPIPLSDFGF